MSAIPPNWMSSILQGTGAAARAQESKRGEAQPGAAAGAFAKDLTEVIQGADRDSQVFSDGEGAGGQGRSAGESGKDGEANARTDDAAGAEGGLDVQA